MQEWTWEAVQGASQRGRSGRLKSSVAGVDTLVGTGDCCDTITHEKQRKDR